MRWKSKCRGITCVARVFAALNKFCSHFTTCCNSCCRCLSWPLPFFVVEEISAHLGIAVLGALSRRQIFQWHVGTSWLFFTFALLTLDALLLRLPFKCYELLWLRLYLVESEDDLLCDALVLVFEVQSKIILKPASLRLSGGCRVIWLVEAAQS